MPDQNAQPAAPDATEVTSGHVGTPSTGIPAAPSRDLTGAVIGDFQIVRLLGKGGMGEVYLANQLSLSREVALKVLRPDLLANATYQARFEAEATAAARLNHPNIIHIYSVGVFEGLRYIAMEYVQGTNLREFLARKGTVELMLALSIMRQAGLAVGAAGEQGLIHRDIKPENLMLTRKGQVKVADFGLCRDQERDLHITQDGVTLGTPMYMSPEQVQGKALDSRSDLYSLGITFYHMLAGSPPFRAETALALALKHLKDTPVSLAVHRPDLPPELCSLVMRLIAKSPADRYPSAAEMLRDLAKIREKISRSTTGEMPTLTDPPDGLAGLEGQRNHTSSAAQTQAASGPSVFDASFEVIRKARPGRGMVVGCLLTGLAAGALTGWASRPTDLLHVRSAGPRLSPALWLAPTWSSIPRQGSAAEQYRLAQMRIPPAELDAAWLAVPGYFPDQHDWSYRAYTQYARSLFRRRDSERLAQLAAALGASDRDGYRAYADIFRAGYAALRRDIAGVKQLLEGKPDSVTDPGLVEFGAEIAQDVVADKAQRQELSPADRTAINQIHQKYLARLLRIETSNAAEPRRPG